MLWLMRQVFVRAKNVNGHNGLSMLLMHAKPLKISLVLKKKKEKKKTFIYINLMFIYGPCDVIKPKAGVRLKRFYPQKYEIY